MNATETTNISRCKCWFLYDRSGKVIFKSSADCPLHCEEEVDSE